MKNLTHIFSDWSQQQLLTENKVDNKSLKVNSLPASFFPRARGNTKYKQGLNLTPVLSLFLSLSFIRNASFLSFCSKTRHWKLEGMHY
jgi:hypothetical protein